MRRVNYWFNVLLTVVGVVFLVFAFIAEELNFGTIGFMFFSLAINGARTDVISDNVGIAHDRVDTVNRRIDLVDGTFQRELHGRD